MDPSITCFHFMGNRTIEQGVFARMEEFVIRPLPPEECVAIDHQLVIRAIAESEERTLRVGFASYGIDGVRYRWIEETREGGVTRHEQLERPDDVFSKAPPEVRIAAHTTAPQTIRV